MSDLIIRLVAVIREHAPDKKPTVAELADWAGLESSPSGKDRDAAWVAYLEASEGGYSVTVRCDGFRRAGRSWAGTTDIGPGELTTDQLGALRADPMFKVVDK